jgi:hypothetical protein
MALKKKIEEVEKMILQMQKTIDEHELKISHLEEKNTLLKELLLAKTVNEPEKIPKKSSINVTSIQRMRTIA